MTVATVAAPQKQEVTKFVSHSLSGFRVAADNLVVWDKSTPPPPIDNRLKSSSYMNMITKVVPTNRCPTTPFVDKVRQTSPN